MGYWIALSLGLPLLVSACGQSLPQPPQPPREIQPQWTEVPSPPPAALPEIVPDQPVDAAWWVDGSWHWLAGRWVWERGKWVSASQGEAYYPGVVRFAKDGRIFYDSPRWVGPEGEPVTEPVAIQSANVPPAEGEPASKIDE